MPRFMAVLLHKPVGCVTTHRDNVIPQFLPEAGSVSGEESCTRKTVYDLLPEHLLDDCGQGESKGNKPKWHAVGRLDVKTSGLLIITNDGGLVHHVTNPKSSNAHPEKKQNIWKTYRALCMGHLNESTMQQLRDGVDLKGGLGCSSPARVELEAYEGNTKTRLLIQINEGKNRQIRRMLHSVHSGVIALERISIGNITMEGVEEPGSWRFLSDAEVLTQLDYDPATRYYAYIDNQNPHGSSTKVKVQQPRWHQDQPAKNSSKVDKKVGVRKYKSDGYKNIDGQFVDSKRRTRGRYQLPSHRRSLDRRKKKFS
eukprot:jgi/Bigna1/126000/aug1.1_g708